MRTRGISFAVAFAVVALTPVSTRAQNPAARPAPASLSSTDYPRDKVGVLIRSADWVPLLNETPAKSHAKHGLAPTFTYGVAPATAVSDYAGLHAQVKIEPGQPVICICHVISLPGTPALVKLHPVKNYRELDGGRLRLGTKVAEAEKNDLIPVSVTQPESMVWLVRPQQPLPEGEYALMLGTQNMSIFSFTVAAANPSSPTQDKH
jgi:hypothetical protein